MKNLLSLTVFLGFLLFVNGVGANDNISSQQVMIDIATAIEEVDNSLRYSNFQGDTSLMILSDLIYEKLDHVRLNGKKVDFILGIERDQNHVDVQISVWYNDGIINLKYKIPIT